MGVLEDCFTYEVACVYTSQGVCMVAVMDLDGRLGIMI